MEGKNACWVPGTDHASIATEAKVIKRLKEQGINKSDLTREEFLKHAWDWTDEHGGIILKQLRKLGCSCDWDRTAFTMDETRSRAVIKVFCDLYKKGLIYRGLRMVNWDPERQTALSDEEVIYHDEHNKFYYLKYRVVEEDLSPSLSQGEGVAKDSEADTNVDVPTFQKGLIIVEKCMLNLESGKYKNVNFGNLHANLTLDKDGILNLQSNKFDIAEGISTLKVRADLIKNKYYLRLGVKDVNSTVMADALLGLPREISGKAMGLVEINSDASLKLNGDIKFNIQNGTIEKIGYVEYILKVASLFRNPLVMISPTTFGDLVNIPDGKFDVIKGELNLKDNVIQRMMIKSSAKQLSSFIIGRYDLNTNDASLRIYTKMSNKGKGFAGFLRNISLNSLANRISSNERNEGNYYSSEIEQIPQIDADEKDAQIFLTKVDGDVINFNFLSSLKRIK